MQLIQAQSIGFCFGVRRAIDMAEGILNERGSLYILGELIHNASVIQRLEALGAVTVNSIEEVPTGETVLIRSHGDGSGRAYCLWQRCGWHPQSQ